MVILPLSVSLIYATHTHARQTKQGLNRISQVLILEKEENLKTWDMGKGAYLNVEEHISCRVSLWT